MKNMTEIYHRIFRKTGAARSLSSLNVPTDKMTLAQKLMKMIFQTEEVELTCDDVFVLIDQFTEMALKGESVAHLMPLVQHHLEICPECREEYEALRQVVGLG
jgi:hypothetical protein